MMSRTEFEMVSCMSVGRVTNGFDSPANLCLQLNFGGVARCTPLCGYIYAFPKLAKPMFAYCLFIQR